jgi:hypothetical protein
MSKKVFGISGLVALLALMLSFQPAFAHESITVGDYEIEVGWVDEPPIVGQQNAILVIVSNTSSGEAQPVEDISSLTITVSYGGQSKELTLQPLGEDTPGQFMAPILPTVAGEYMITLGGQLGDTPVDNAHAEPEEVEPADTLQFPSLDSSGQSAGSGMTDWLIYLSLMIGLIALGLGVMALRKAG